MVRYLALALIIAACGESASDEPDAGVDGVPGPPTAAELRARIATCDPVIGGPFAADSSDPSVIPICGLPGAVFWKADLDVDCDGKMTAQCSLSTDPYYMNQTAATDSQGQPLDAAALPYVVLPGKSTRFDYAMAGLKLGSVFAVIYKDQVQYGVAGDIGPTAVIGEASYRMAELLGIDPDPRIGGTDEEVAYIGFTGPDAITVPIEDHDRAVSIGLEFARALVQ
ncbi:MAG TPA: glycoside hydrolase family 75 protein [Kofleriaceae bacterium]